MTKPTLFPKPFKLNRDWMDLPERKTFERMKESGQISFFRTQLCAGPKCKNDVPKVKLYCSIECREKREKEIEEENGKDIATEKEEGHGES